MSRLTSSWASHLFVGESFAADLFVNSIATLAIHIIAPNALET